MADTRNKWPKAGSSILCLLQFYVSRVMEELLRNTTQEMYPDATTETSQITTSTSKTSGLKEKISMSILQTSLVAKVYHIYGQLSQNRTKQSSCRTSCLSVLLSEKTRLSLSLSLFLSLSPLLGLPCRPAATASQCVCSSHCESKYRKRQDSYHSFTSFMQIRGFLRVLSPLSISAFSLARTAHCSSSSRSLCFSSTNYLR